MKKGSGTVAATIAVVLALVWVCGCGDDDTVPAGTAGSGGTGAGGSAAGAPPGGGYGGDGGSGGGVVVDALCQPRAPTNPDGRPPIEAHVHSSNLFQVALPEEALQPSVNLVAAVDGHAYAVTVPAGTMGCDPTGDDWGRGYEDLAALSGGATASICQTDLVASMKHVMAEIIASASLLSPSHLPIGSSLAVGIDEDGSDGDAAALARSRTSGFAYSSVSNKCTFHGLALTDDPYPMMVSYQRWVP